MRTFVYLVCIAVASFTVLAQPAVAQGTNATLPLTPSGVCQLIMWLRNGILTVIDVKFGTTCCEYRKKTSAR